MEQKEIYKPKPGENKFQEAYTGPKKMAEVPNLLDGIENLVSKENLAGSYRQEGGQ